MPDPTLLSSPSAPVWRKLASSLRNRFVWSVLLLAICSLGIPFLPYLSPDLSPMAARVKVGDPVGKVRELAKELGLEPSDPRLADRDPAPGSVEPRERRRLLLSGRIGRRWAFLEIEVRGEVVESVALRSMDSGAPIPIQELVGESTRR